MSIPNFQLQLPDNPVVFGVGSWKLGVEKLGYLPTAFHSSAFVCASADVWTLM
jgi:hypothetical protein